MKTAHESKEISNANSKEIVEKEYRELLEKCEQGIEYACLLGEYSCYISTIKDICNRQENYTEKAQRLVIDELVHFGYRADFQIGNAQQTSARITASGYSFYNMSAIVISWN